MTITAKTLKATDSLYSKPIGYENNQDVENDVFYEPITYTAEMEKIITRLKNFLLLEKGWDGYSAVIPKEITIDNVILVIQNLKDKYVKLLDEEDVVPSSYGTVSLYFEDLNNNEVAVEFGKEFIGVSGEINGEEIIIDELPIYDFHVAIENINKLTVAN